MSTENGQANGKGKLLSLDEARVSKTRKGNDFITVQQAYDMVIQECAKVHEYYLEQIPTFVARMIQDALMTYGLIVAPPGADIAPAVATAGTADAIPPSGDTAADDTMPPLVVIDPTAPMEPPAA